MTILEGIVVRGKGRGKQLGFPTANIHITTHIPEGVDLSKVLLLGKDYHALTFIGAAKTFQETAVFAETYLLDKREDFYGEVLTIHLLEKLRDNQTFSSAEELILQMKKDLALANAKFAILKKTV